jgi:uncharacterized protein (DUF952 family)/uncharacterized protein YqgV (UPF0045/DUF77 family)
MKNIYHITTAEAWQDAIAAGFYTHPSLAAEGFIHCSEPHQILGVLDRYYQNTPNLLLLCIDTDVLAAPLVFELAPSVNDLFPHIYGTILPAEVVHIYDLNKADWKQDLFIINAAIQVVPMHPQAIAYPMIDEVIEMISNTQLSYRVTPFNTCVEGTLQQVMQAVEKINYHLFQHQQQTDWLCNVQLHASNQGHSTMEQKLHNHFTTN